MVNIIGKIVAESDPSKIIQYKFRECGDDASSGLGDYEVMARDIYTIDNLQELISSGYQFLDYYGSVKTPDGILINELPTVEHMSDMEVMELDGMEGDIVSEVEFISNYQYREISIASSVEILEPESPTLKTREEFLNYLGNIKSTTLKGAYIPHLNNINEITDKSALFTLSEIFSGSASDAKELYNFYMRSMVASTLEDIKKFMARYGSAQEDILMNYYKYGVPCLNATVLSVELVHRPLFNTRMPAERIQSLAPFRYAISSKDSGLVISTDFDSLVSGDVLTGKENIIDGFKFIDVTSDTYGFKSDILEDYDIIRYRAYKQNPCIKITLTDDSGVRVVCYATVDTITFTRENNTNCYTVVDINHLTTIGGNTVRLSDIIDNGFDYVKNVTYIRGFVKDCIERHSVKPRFSSSIDAIIHNGVSAYFAPRYAVKMAKSLEAASDCISKFDSSLYDMRMYCHESMIKGLSPKIVAKYLGDQEFDSFEDQLEAINAVIDSKIDSGTYLTEDQEIDSRAVISEVKDNEVDNINFAYLFYRGDINVGNICIGQVRDSERSDIEIVDVISSLYRANKDSYANIVDFLNNIEMYFTRGDQSRKEKSGMSKIIGERKYMAQGAIKDSLWIRSNLNRNAKNFVIIESAYREFSNVTGSDKHRHFGVRANIIPIKTSRIGKDICKIIDNAIYSAYEAEDYLDYLPYAAHSTDSIIVDLLNKTSKINRDRSFANEYLDINNCFNVELKDNLMGILSTPVTIEFRIPYATIAKLLNEVYSKTFSLMDFIVNQFENDDNFTCNYKLVNAIITPWRVINTNDSKPIKDYPFYVNYCSRDTMDYIIRDSSYAENIKPKVKRFMDAARDNGISADDIGLVEVFDVDGLVPDFIVRSKEELEDLVNSGYFMETHYRGYDSCISIEPITAYYMRCIKNFKDKRVFGKEAGESLRKNLLQADTVMKPIAQYVESSEYVLDETEYIPKNPKVNSIRTWGHDVVDVELLTGEIINDNQIVASKTKVRKFTTDNLKFEDLLSIPKLCGLDFSSERLIYDGTVLRTIDNTKNVYVESLTTEDMDEFVSMGFGQQKSTYTYVVSVVGGYLEVNV